MTLTELETAYSTNYLKWVAMARIQLAKTPALQSVSGEDVVQTVMLHLFGEDRHLLVPLGEDGNRYIYTCIKNRIHALVSRAVDIQVPAHEEIAYYANTHGPEGPAAVAEFTELQETIRKVINTFPTDGSKEFLTKVYLEGWTQAEAMRALGYTSMQSTCWRFRERLAEELGE